MRSGLALSSSLILASMLAAGCGPADEDPALDPSLAIEDEAAAPVALRARAGDTTVWIDPILTRRRAPDGNTFLTMNGRASRNITGGMGFVFDDPYGDFRTASARTFGVWYAPTELTSLVVGVQQFVGIDFAPSATRPARLTARVTVAPTLSGFTGSGLYIDAATAVTSVGGRPVLRITGRSDRDLRGFRVSAGDVAIPDFRLESPRRFVVFLGMDHVIALAGSTARLTLTGVAPRSTVTKSARIDLAVTALDLTDGDAYEVWPGPTCAPATLACLSALPAGSADLSSCGSYLAVQQCAGRTSGAIVDDVAFQSGLARARARLTAIGLERDATGLVGAARAASFSGVVDQTIEARFEGLFGRRYPSATERDAALDAEAESAIDAAYARPLDLIEAVAPLPNDAQRARDAAADALLLHIAGLDLRETEWARPLEELARTYRARHVASIRDFREVGEIIASNATRDVLGGRWLDAYVEISVERATGRVTQVFFEVD